MIDDKTIWTMLEGMQSAAEEALRDDPAFYETLRSLKDAIDWDPRVQSVVSRLDATGSKVHSSLIPRVKIRVRTSTGEISLPDQDKLPVEPSAPVAHLTQELKNATCAVMIRGRYREELDAIMNQAVGTCDRFEGFAVEVERAGYEVVICLDLSAYARVQESGRPSVKTRNSASSKEPLARLLSGQDLKFLKDLKIKAIED
jgi:hypothetical protein